MIPFLSPLTMRPLLSFAAASILLMTAAVQAQAPDIIPPDNMVKAPSVDGTGEQHVNLSWEALKDNVGVVAYRVYYSETSYLSKSQASDGAAQFARFKQVTEPRATIDGLTKGKKYYFTVTGLDAAGNESEYVATEAEATIGQGSSSPLPSASPTSVAPTPGSVSASPSPVPSPSPSPSASPIALTENEIRDLTLTLKRMAETYDVTLAWKLPPAPGNIAQILYRGSEGSPLSKLATLLPSATSYVAEKLAPGKYDFKVATIGADGIESAGVMTSIELIATGPSVILAGLASLMGAVGWRRRQKNSAK